MIIRDLLFAAAALVGATNAHAGAVLDRVRTQHQVNCGVVTDQDDYSKEDTHGNLAAFGADLCRAVTAAVLGSDAKVIVSAYPDEPTGLAAVAAGKIDILGAATPSLQNRAHYAVQFGPVILYDGQGFLAPDKVPDPVRDRSGGQADLLYRRNRR